MYFIKEPFDLWHNLASTKKEIVIYGTGNGAIKTLNKCSEHNIKVSDIFASDAFVRGQSFLGYKILTYNQVIEKYGKDIIVLLAFGSENIDMLEHFFDLASKHELLAPNFPLFGDTHINISFLESNREEIMHAYSLLEDDFSRKVFSNICNYKISGKVEYLRSISTNRREDITVLLNLSASERYLDLGAYNGDTVDEFLQLTNSQYESIIAVEADKKNFQKLTNRFSQQNIVNLNLIYQGIWSEKTCLTFNNAGGRASAIDPNSTTSIDVNNIDNILNNQFVSFIKMDIEGAEHQALAGAVHTLTKYQPKLLIAAYHHDDDFFTLPLKLKQINPKYKIFLRKHPYLPAWEINMFAV